MRRKQRVYPMGLHGGKCLVVLAVEGLGHQRPSRARRQPFRGGGGRWTGGKEAEYSRAGARHRCLRCTRTPECRNDTADLGVARDHWNLEIVSSVLAHEAVERAAGARLKPSRDSDPQTARIGNRQSEIRDESAVRLPDPQ